MAPARSRQDSGHPTSSIARSALEMWRHAAAERLVLDACHSRELMALVATRSPDQSPHTPRSGLRTRRGNVHFLDFWQAAAAAWADGEAAVGLPAELEVLRERVLDRLEFGVAEAVLPAWALVEELHGTAPTSSSPGFWRAAVASLGSRGQAELGLQELTEMFVAWIDASDGDCEDLASVENQRAGMPVRLHVYDCTRKEHLRLVNRVLAHESSPIKFGGIFHASVEVGGVEWRFDYQPDLSKPAVSCCMPKTLAHHNYRQTICLGNTTLSQEAVSAVILQLIAEYPPGGYDLLRRNCCTFAEDLCIRLGVGGIPSWIHRLARIGASLESAALFFSRGGATIDSPAARPALAEIQVASI